MSSQAINSKGTTATYKYLPNHYRMSKTVDGILTQQIWDGDNIVAEANSVNTIIRSYTRGHQLLTDDDRRAYMYDGHGNLVQQNRGNTAENVTRYDAYGNKIEKSGTTNDTPFGYCGEYLDKESGLIYLRNRYYDSESGRFISEDPIRDGVNWYAYCSGNPVRFCDPLGLKITYQKSTPDKTPEGTDMYSIRFISENLAKELGCSVDIKVDNKEQKVDIIIGPGVYDVKGTFYFDGTAEINGKRSTQKMTLNDNGTIKTSFTNFLDIMGIKNETSVVIKTSKGKMNFAVKAVTAIGLGIVVSYMPIGMISASIADLVISNGSSYLIDKAIP